MGLSFDCQFSYPHHGFGLDVAFQAADGVTALLGPSGSGKTTVVNLIAGLLRPRTGRIELAGRLLADEALCLAPEARNVGLVMQESLLFPHLTVRQNLLFGHSRKNPARSAPDFDQLAQVLEIGDCLDRSPHTLSGGQARRVALGRALLRAPELLVLDEPLTGLDEPLRDRVLELIASALREWPVPTLLVTHDTKAAATVAQAQVVIVDGRRAG